jgi:hypothetical protein
MWLLSLLAYCWLCYCFCYCDDCLPSTTVSNVTMTPLMPLSVALPPNLGPGRLIVEIFRSHTTRHTHTHTYTHLWLLWARNQPVAEAATYRTLNKRKGGTFVPPTGREPAIPLIERPLITSPQPGPSQLDNIHDKCNLNQSAVPSTRDTQKDARTDGLTSRL